MNMKEKEVASLLDIYFKSLGIETIGKINIFDHIDDTQERSFSIDFATKPLAQKGNRTRSQQDTDESLFSNNGGILDPAIDQLKTICAFPTPEDHQWNSISNPNPMVGIAVEIENTGSKYFLGSLLAASIAGRWGILVIPNNQTSDLWINTIRRMIHKGSNSPIPSNIIIIKFNELESYLTNQIQPSESATIN